MRVMVNARICETLLAAAVFNNCHLIRRRRQQQLVVSTGDYAGYRLDTCVKATFKICLVRTIDHEEN